VESKEESEQEGMNEMATGRASKEQEVYRQFLLMLRNLSGKNAGDKLIKRQQDEKKNNSQAKLAAQIHCYFSPVSCGVGRG